MRRVTRLVVAPLIVVIACLMGHPAVTVQRFNDTLLDVMKKGPALGPLGRYEALRPVVGRTFDIAYMTRVAVGPTWATLPAAQQESLTSAFARHITATYAERFDRFSGQKFQIAGEQPSGETGAFVDSRIVRADGTVVALRYLMRQEGAAWRIADVLLSGTISELATRRSEFTSIVKRQGVDALIATLNQQSDRLIGAPRS